MNLVIDLANTNLGQLGIRDREIPVGLGLLEFEFRDEVRVAKFALPAQLAIELPDVDLGTFQEHLLLGPLQQQRCLVDRGNRVARLDDSAGLGDHDELTGDASRYLDIVAAVYRSRNGDGRRDLGLLDEADLHDGRRHLLRAGSGRNQEKQACRRKS